MPGLIQVPLFKISIVFLLLFLCQAVLKADERSRPDSHAPLGVMGDHTHAEGEFMFSYRFMNMTMEDNRDGTDTLDTRDVLTGGNNTGDYMVVPLEMTMDMHTLGMMYAPNNQVTWMLMLPYLDVSMDHLIGPAHPMHPNESFTTEASGLGDIKLSALINLEKNHKQSALLGLGLSFPTGSIDEEDEILSMPALGKTQLPFPMQLGSGTFDLLPSFTYTRYLENRSWGMQLSSVVRIGQNDNNYTLGNRLKASSWHAWVLNDELSLSGRLIYEHWDNIDGDDQKRALPATMTMGNMTVGTVPTVEPRNQAGDSLDAAVGLNGIYGASEHRLALELVVPLEQKLSGPQMERDLVAVFGYQKAF